MLIFLFGQDDFRSRQKLNEIKIKFRAEVDASSSSLNVFNGQKIDLKELSGALNAQSLLARKRMVVIEDIFLNKGKNLFSDILEFFIKIQADKCDNIIVVWESAVKSNTGKNKGSILDSSGGEKVLNAGQQKLFEYLNKQKFAQEFKQLSGAELLNWVKKKCADTKCRIANDAAQLIINYAENNLWQINTELEKIISYKMASGEILLKDVEEMAKGKIDDSIFNLTDAISSKNRALALKLLSRQYEAGMADGYIISMFLRQFKILLQIRQALDFGANSRKIITDLKLHPFVVQKGINQARNFNLKNLKNLINQLLKIDSAAKSGKTNCRAELDLLISKI